MTWPQLRGHLRALAKRREARALAQSGVTDVDSWDGADRDTFFDGHFGRKR